MLIIIILFFEFFFRQCHTIFCFQNHRFKWQIRPFKKTTNNTNVRHRYPSRAKALRCMQPVAWCVYLLKPSARDDVFTILGNLFLGNFSSRFITVFLNLQPTLLKHVCIILFVTDSPVAKYLWPKFFSSHVKIGLSES